MTVAIKISLLPPASTDAENDEAKVYCRGDTVVLGDILYTTYRNPSISVQEARKSMMHEAQLMSFYTHDNIIQVQPIDR